MKLTSPRLKDGSVKELQRALDTLVGNINELLARQDNIRGATSSSKASENQIKVEKVDGNNYKLSIRTKDGWAETDLITKER